MNGDAQGAEEEFANKKLPFLVQVGVDLTATYPGPPYLGVHGAGPPSVRFSAGFRRSARSTNKVIDAQSTQVYLFYSDAVFNTYGISGATIEYRFDPEKIDPDDEVTIVVNTPDDQDVETTFDLGHLR